MSGLTVCNVLTLLHLAPALHEDVERLERLIVLDFKGETKTHKERLAQNHRVRRRLDAMQGGAKKLVGGPVALLPGTC